MTIYLSKHSRPTRRRLTRHINDLESDNRRVRAELAETGRSVVTMAAQAERAVAYMDRLADAGRSENWIVVAAVEWGHLRSLLVGGGPAGGAVEVSLDDLLNGGEVR